MTLSKNFTLRLVIQYFFSVQTSQWGLTQHLFGQIFCLYNYEADFIYSLIKTDKPRTIKFKHVLCVIDDESNLNDSDEFCNSFHVSYPDELHLICEHHGLDTTFFDLDILLLMLFTNTNFTIREITIHFLLVTIVHMLLWVNLSEFIRIAKCTLKFSDFVPKAKQLFLRMISQGANQVNLLKQTKKAM